MESKSYLLLFVMLCQVYFCKPQSNNYLFNDCVKEITPYCFSFEHEIQYRRNDALRVSWGSSKSYAFISEIDTLYISLYKHKIDINTLKDYSVDSLKNGRLLPNTCNEKEWGNINATFHGSYVYCNQENIGYLVFIGYLILDKQQKGYSILVESKGIKNSEIQKKNFDKIVESMNLYTN